MRPYFANTALFLLSTYAPLASLALPGQPDPGNVVNLTKRGCTRHRGQLAWMDYTGAVRGYVDKGQTGLFKAVVTDAGSAPWFHYNICDGQTMYQLTCEQCGSNSAGQIVDVAVLAQSSIYDSSGSPTEWKMVPQSYSLSKRFISSTFWETNPQGAIVPVPYDENLHIRPGWPFQAHQGSGMEIKYGQSIADEDQIYVQLWNVQPPITLNDPEPADVGVLLCQ